jgi:hypothetical protein
MAEAAVKVVWSHSNDGGVTIVIVAVRVMLMSVNMAWRGKRGGRQRQSLRKNRARWF